MEKIFEACAAAEVPAPRIRAELGGLWLEFNFPREPDAGSAIGGSIGGPIELTDRQKEIVGIINSNVKISLREIAKQMRLNRSAIDKHMNTLIEAGILKRIGGTRGHR